MGGGSDGVGVLPLLGPATSQPPTSQLIEAPTYGLVVDSQRGAVAGTTVIVTHPALGVVAQAHTDVNGSFVVVLPNITDLELALPDEAIAGVHVSAGVAITIVLP